MCARFAPTAFLRSSPIEQPHATKQRQPRRHIGSLLACWVVVWAATGAAGQVRWRSDDSMAAAGHTSTTSVLTMLNRAAPVTHIVVQFRAPLAEATRVQLEADGLQLLSYLGGNAYFAAVTPGGLDTVALLAEPQLAGAWSIEGRWKLAPVLARGETPEWAVVPAPADNRFAERSAEVWIGAYVLFHADVSAQDAQSLLAAAPVIVRQRLVTVNGAVIELPRSAVDALVA
ncbi:MAG TPA: hypothetical protein P5572_16425, partial [Phycisphaerae bacterium]|nr:hypothetical protein [Phycisphaerae bacterium]